MHCDSFVSHADDTLSFSSGDPKRVSGTQFFRRGTLLRRCTVRKLQGKKVTLLIRQEAVSSKLIYIFLVSIKNTWFHLEIAPVNETLIDKVISSFMSLGHL